LSSSNISEISTLAAYFRAAVVVEIVELFHSAPGRLAVHGKTHPAETGKKA
jgi:hypothetical protein